MATTGHRRFFYFIQHSVISLSVHGLVQIASMNHSIVLGGQGDCCEHEQQRERLKKTKTVKTTRPFSYRERLSGGAYEQSG
jgi:hypothetical protein